MRTSNDYEQNQLQRIGFRLSMAKQLSKKARAKRIRELHKKPNSPGPSPEECQIQVLLDAIEDTAFFLENWGKWKM